MPKIGPDEVAPAAAGGGSSSLGSGALRRGGRRRRRWSGRRRRSCGRGGGGAVRVERILRLEEAEMRELLHRGGEDDLGARDGGPGRGAVAAGAGAPEGVAAVVVVAAAEADGEPPLLSIPGSSIASTTSRTAPSPARISFCFFSFAFTSFARAISWLLLPQLGRCSIPAASSSSVRGDRARVHVGLEVDRRLQRRRVGRVGARVIESMPKRGPVH